MTSRTFNLLKALCVFATASLGSTACWMFHTFSTVSLSQTATILFLDMGAGAVPWELTLRFMIWAILVPAVLTGVVCFSAWLEQRGRRLASLAALASLLPGLILFSLKVNFGFFSRVSPGVAMGGNIFDQYKPPPAAATARQKPLNVIWIFVESLESEYADPSMNAEIEKATSFMTPLTVTPLINQFTVGAVMSAKCGAPMYFTRALVTQFHYAGFNNATCFDDVLRGAGYQSYFVVGHDASLSGFRRYYEKHASAKIYDQKYLASRKTPKDSEFSSYPDEQVFDTAMGILKSADLGKPYSMNILTYDNHAPDGLPSNRCQSQFGSDMASVIRCDNHVLAGFIEELDREALLQNTVLVVMGDHPFAGYFSQLPVKREIFARIYTPLGDKKVCNQVPTPFDFFPSVLSAMGFEVGQRQYGYGYSFYDVPAYPVRDWRGWVNTFPAAKPTSGYRTLFE